MFVFASLALLGNNKLISRIGEGFSTERCLNILSRLVGVGCDYTVYVHRLLLTCSRVPAGNDEEQCEEISPPRITEPITHTESKVLFFFQECVRHWQRSGVLDQ